MSSESDLLVQQPEQQESKSISKKAAKKEARKLEKLRRGLEKVACTTTTSLPSSSKEEEVEEDPLASNYGDVPLSEEADLNEWTRVGELDDDRLKEKVVSIRGTVQTVRPTSKDTAFVVLREEEGGFTVQCVVNVKTEGVSRGMVKFAAAITRESVVDITGVVSVPPKPIEGTTTQKIEVKVTKFYCISRVAGTLPEDASMVIQQQKVIIIPNKHGENLVGVLHDTGSKEIGILCHGFRSTKETQTMVNLAAGLEKEGISAFRFDFAGNGESEGTFEYGSYWKEAEDLRSVIEHFRGANHVVHAIVGHSKGGGVVLLYASKYHDISTVVNLSGRYDLKRGVEDRFGKNFMEKMKEDGFFDVKNKAGAVIYRVTHESLMDRLNTDMNEACLLIDKECRVLTIHGSADEVIPIEDAHEFAKIIPNHKLHVIEGANHSYTSHQAELTSLVLSTIISASPLASPSQPTQARNSVW